MKQAKVNLPSGTYLIQEVPEVAMAFQVTRIIGISGLHYGIQTEPLTIDVYSQPLPPGSWQLLGADPTRLTEEEAGEIVEWWDSPTGGGDFQDYYKNYTTETPDNYMHLFHFTDPLHSLSSLAASLGIEKPFVVLKNVEK